MNGVTFGEYHSYNDLSLYLNSKSISAPTVKTSTVEIEGGDGVLDLTEYFGRVNYDNRTLSFEFTYIGEPSEFMTVFSALQNKLHGKKMRITLDDDPDYYYKGRVTLSAWKADKTTGTITVDVDAEPYKYKQNKTSVTDSVTDSADITLTNDVRSAVPLITTTADFTIVYNGTTTVTTAGTFTIPTLELKEGNNVVSVTGTGDITFEWQEGRL